MRSKSSPVAYCAALAFSLAAALSGRAAGQDDLPVVRANSTTADIQDGNRLLHGGWTIQPDVGLDTYYARRASGGRRVTLRTDIESISFDVRPGRHYDFVVLLDGKQKCRTRISTLHETCYEEGTPGAPAGHAIPFSIGDDLKIHITGKIDESAPLDLLFDTGADTLALFPSGLAKCPNLRVDGSVKNAGIGGVVTCRTSSDNRVKLGALRWDHESIVLIDKQVDHADGVVGHNLFEDKVVEIDYDAMLLRIGDAVPGRARSWTALPIRFNGTLPALQVRFECGPGAFAEWLVMDTGSDMSVQLNGGSAETRRLLGAMKRLGSGRAGGTGDGMIRNEVALLPRLGLGKEGLRELPIHIEESSGATRASSGRLGMDVLKRFNTVLDFRNDVSYLSPSSLYGDPYRFDRDNGRWKAVLAVAAAFLPIAGVLWYRRRAVARSRVKPTGGLGDRVD
jgi:hypothetical protein